MLKRKLRHGLKITRNKYVSQEITRKAGSKQGEVNENTVKQHNKTHC